ncbi:OmpA family protein [Aurantibacter sp.]|uniref:OmpA family protein n=1 Tax=Aurantibacter sp. TaxID=2807103 RepID=UPI0035C828A9
MKYIYITLCCIIQSNLLCAQQKNSIVNEDLFTLEKTSLSTENTEFGAFLTNNNVVYFTRANSNLTANNKNESDLNIYQGVLSDKRTIIDVRILNEINTKWHDGPTTITSDGKSMYFSSESFNVNKGFKKEKTFGEIKKRGEIYLFRASRINNKWTKKTPLPFNNIEYSIRNPSISSDGKTLYFSSNMPGGFGGEDLWKVNVNQNSYGEPKNLGSTINSINDESFPFITNNNVLYFSSNRTSELGGPEGLGGLDVYMINLNKNQEIINLGTPINSEKDDFYFSLNENKKIGFLSSNREGSDNIYLITPNCHLIANIRVINKETGLFINNAELNILNEKKIIKKGLTRSKLKCRKSYNILVSKKGYESTKYNIEANNEGGEMDIIIEMHPNKNPIITKKEVVLQPIYFEYNKARITEQGGFELNKLVTVMYDNPNMKIFVKSHTDNVGNKLYNKKLSNHRAKNTVEYLISKGIAKERITGKGFGESELKINCENCTDIQNSKNRRSEFIIMN